MHFIVILTYRCYQSPTEDEKLEADAKERGFSYVRMDGNIGCMVNGAGLAMTTMDMIKIYGGNPANFLILAVVPILSRWWKLCRFYC